MEVIITKSATRKLTDTDFQITIHAEITDNAVIVLDKDYSERYNSSVAISEVRTKLQNQIVADWDIYVAEQVIHNASAFDTMITDIQTAANTYING